MKDGMGQASPKRICKKLLNKKERKNKMKKKRSLPVAELELLRMTIKGRMMMTKIRKTIRTFRSKIFTCSETLTTFLRKKY